MIKKIVLSLALIVFFSNSSLAFEKNAENFILETTQNAKKIILDKAIGDKDKRKQLEKLALNTVDVAGLAKYTLGQERKNLSDKQISEFVSTFKVFFSKNLSNKLKDYSDQEVKITGSKKISDNYVLVNSKIVSLKDKQEIAVDWRVFLVDGNLIIRDLVVEGLSLARTQREEFASIIANKKFEGLIQSLNEYITNN
ncbi:ABC transporter substrate-binding protein [Pelagibacteraceae bacterium]|jgi:phospholipid transport system substrate-binding protein|nr:ABC transporter substrate-binding protein [Candidatus Pelagibacter sp.]MDC1256169.1 ABC transporter substrate-binding protein [Pelagibacteraceae bacterium]